MEVEKLAVHPQHRNKGVAKLLLLDGMRIAAEKNCKNAFLEVGEYNLSAIGLYESFGFKRISVRKKYYSTAENAIVMQKKF
jgi:ribosomal-protein-alanine N-acetyltransferase